MESNSKLIKEKRQIAVIGVLLGVVLVMLANFYVYYSFNFSYNENNLIDIETFKLYFYGDISDAYQDDKEVIKVYELCLDSEIKSVCVYENIEFIWSEALEFSRRDYFFSPTELVEHGGHGICRDIAVFRMAVFKKLNIPAEFVFIPRHVYVRTFENGMVYELDNGDVRDKTKRLEDGGTFK